MTKDSPGIRPGRWSPATREALAAEYALGTLRGPARTRFERLLAVDDDLRRRVRQWQDRLGAWVAEAAPEPPPASVWQGIRERVGEGTAAGADGPATEGHRRWWDSLPLWRGLAIAASLLLALTLGWSLGGGPRGMAPERMAVVTDPEQQPIWVVSSGSPARTLRVRTLRSPGMGPDRVCPLWLQWDDGERMRRVAILPEEEGVYTFRLPRGMPVDRARLAVSVEPAEAVPQDRPRGKVVYEGDWVRL
jgi:anti-sigma-K factor RskA